MKTFSNPLYKNDQVQAPNSNDYPGTFQKQINPQYNVPNHMVIQEQDQSVSQLRGTQFKQNLSDSNRGAMSSLGSTFNPPVPPSYSSNQQNKQAPPPNNMPYRNSTNHYLSMQNNSNLPFSYNPNTNTVGVGVAKPPLPPQQSYVNMEQILSSQTGESSRLEDSLLNNFNSNIDHLNISDKQSVTRGMDHDLDDFLRDSQRNERSNMILHAGGNIAYDDVSFQRSLLNLMDGQGKNKYEFGQSSLQRQQEQYNRAFKDMNDLYAQIGSLDDTSSRLDTSNNIRDSKPPPSTNQPNKPQENITNNYPNSNNTNQDRKTEYANFTQKQDDDQLDQGYFNPYDQERGNPINNDRAGNTYQRPTYDEIKQQYNIPITQPSVKQVPSQTNNSVYSANSSANNNANPASNYTNEYQKYTDEYFQSKYGQEQNQEEDKSQSNKNLQTGNYSGNINNNPPNNDNGNYNNLHSYFNKNSNTNSNNTASNNYNPYPPPLDNREISKFENYRKTLQTVEDTQAPRRQYNEERMQRNTTVASSNQLTEQPKPVLSSYAQFKENALKQKDSAMPTTIQQPLPTSYRQTVDTNPARSVEPDQYTQSALRTLNKENRRIFTRQQKQYLKTTQDHLKKDGIDQYPFSKPNIRQLKNDELPVFCINCEEYIPLSDVDNHSKQDCRSLKRRDYTKFQFSKEDKSKQQPDNITNVLEELNQQLSYLFKKITDQQKNGTVLFGNLIGQAKESLDNIMKNNVDQISIQTQVNLIQNIRSYIEKSNETHSVLLLILLQRAILLSDEQALKIQYCVEFQKNGTSGISSAPTSASLTTQINNQNNLSSNSGSSNNLNIMNIPNSNINNYQIENSATKQKSNIDTSTSYSELSGYPFISPRSETSMNSNRNYMNSNQIYNQGSASQHQNNGQEQVVVEKTLQEQLKDLQMVEMKEQANLEFWKFQSEMMQDIKQHDLQNLRFVKTSKVDPDVLSQIHSDMESNDALSSDGTLTSRASDVGFGFQNPVPYSKGQSGEQDKRLFYSDAVAVKLNLPYSHQGRDVLIADMYNECLRKGIAQDNYQQFITQYLGLQSSN